MAQPSDCENGFIQLPCGGAEEFWVGPRLALLTHPGEGTPMEDSTGSGFALIQLPGAGAHVAPAGQLSCADLGTNPPTNGEPEYAAAIS